MQTVSTGWRRPARFVQPPTPTAEVSSTDLFAVARLAVKSLNLRPGARFVLEQLVGCWGGELLGGRYLVWPSNEFLMDRTGLSERGVRYAIRSLLELGVIVSKESANGKRFAIRSANGQIRDAYGLDLSPLLSRREEFTERCEEIKVAREYRRRQFDEITVCRRSVQELLRALKDWFDKPTGDLQREFERLAAITPRRDSLASPEAALAAWRALHEVTKEQYDAACGGNNSRIIEDNNDTPDQSCNKAYEKNVAGPNLVELAAACPDAMSFMPKVADERDLIRAVSTLRGAFGTHESAWNEAMEMLGAAQAAKAFVVVLQRATEDNGEKIKNVGGYFRAYARMIEQGRVDLGLEVRGMRRRRAH